MDFHVCLERMVEDFDIQMKIMEQVQKYKLRLGYFTANLASKTIETLDPMAWGDSFGVSTPDLMTLAKCILGLCCTASSCERNWSTFNFIHTKRSKFEAERLGKLVYINYTKKLHDSYQESKLRRTENYDPIHVDELNFSHEWITGIEGPSNEFVYNESRLTWVEGGRGRNGGNKTHGTINKESTTTSHVLKEGKKFITTTC